MGNSIQSSSIGKRKIKNKKGVACTCGQIGKTRREGIITHSPCHEIERTLVIDTYIYIKKKPKGKAENMKTIGKFN